MAELPGGFTLDDLARLSRYVVFRFRRRGMILDDEEAVDIAAVAIVERLYGEPAPDELDLYRAAHAALSSANYAEVRHVGLDANASRSGRDGVPNRFAAYWYGRDAVVDPFEDRITERIATWQVMAALTPRDQNTLLTLARYGTYEGARAALDLGTTGWRLRLRAARAAAREAWHWPDPPAAQWMPDQPGLPDDPKCQNRAIRALRLRRKARERKAA